MNQRRPRRPQKKSRTAAASRSGPDTDRKAAAGEPALAPAKNGGQPAERKVTDEGPQAATKTGQLRLQAGQPLGRSVRGAIAEIFDYARTMAAEAPSNPERSVHEYRKSIRRARALLRLMRPEIKKKAFIRVKTGLQASVRATSGFRDTDVLIETCKSIRMEGLPKQTLKAARALLRLRRAVGRGDDHAAATLADLSQRLESIEKRFADCVDSDYSWTELRHGIEKTYERARDSFYKAKADPVDDAIHDWRKRVKEVRYQLELMRSLGDREELRASHEQFSQQATELGGIADLIALRVTLKDFQPAIPRKAFVNTEAALRQCIRERFEAAAKESAVVYERRPESFALLVVPDAAPEPG